MVHGVRVGTCCGAAVNRRVGRWLRELDQHAVVGARVDEANHPRQPLARLGVDHVHALGFGSLEFSGHVGGPEAQVMKALAVGLQEPSNAGPLPRGLEQLDLAIVEGEDDAAHTLIIDFPVDRLVQAERVAPEFGCFIYVADDDANCDARGSGS